ncbi:ABC transporter F family member 4 [Fopius arisanus]|uniref:ABC transporter F family member 4 n=1 Tax=Fopius arisanus TaxID=64838 RepID=A0A0C9R3I7_9HYME|nr:PREDICTED: ABC transporter F family member 4-like [Fopius arisanus]
MERTRTYERSSNEDVRNKLPQEAEFGPKKTMLVLAIVAGCFAVLWPKIFYPMLTGPAHTTHTSPDGSVCCDLIFESDVNTVDILQEMCQNILKHHQIDPRVRDALRTNKLTSQSASFCRDEVLARCGIDLSSFLAEKERLGKTHKQVLEEIRSFNSSLCLRNNFGVPLAQLGTPHLIRYHILMPHTPLRQERRLPPHAGGLHPAMRERGRAIPTSHIVPRVDGRPEHVVVQKMRPPMGGPGRVVPPPSGGGGTMGIILPLYTIGILLFFLYTIAKILRKNSNNEIYQDYQNPEAEREFRDRVFNPDILSTAITGTNSYRKERSPSPKQPLPTIQELQALDEAPNSNGPAGVALKSKGEYLDKQCYQGEDGMGETDDSGSAMKVMGMEMTATSESGQKISRPTTPIFPDGHSPEERERTPPKPIYLEGTLPPQCEILVSDSETQEESSEENSEAAIVLSSKVTLSLISHDQNSPDSIDSIEHSNEDGEILANDEAGKMQNSEIPATRLIDEEEINVISDVKDEEEIVREQHDNEETFEGAVGDGEVEGKCEKEDGVAEGAEQVNEIEGINMLGVKQGEEGSDEEEEGDVDEEEYTDNKSLKRTGGEDEGEEEEEETEGEDEEKEPVQKVIHHKDLKVIQKEETDEEEGEDEDEEEEEEEDEEEGEEEDEEEEEEEEEEDEEGEQTEVQKIQSKKFTGIDKLKGVKMSPENNDNDGSQEEDEEDDDGDVEDNSEEDAPKEKR